MTFREFCRFIRYDATTAMRLRLAFIVGVTATGVTALAAWAWLLSR
jgi:hypothetical protein